jgi:enoyl-CoA hydratase/carnithine racemase
VADPTSSVLVHERRGPILVLRLNRPDARNALNAELRGALNAGMSEADSDPEVRAVVLTGTGDGAFCAGMDLRSFAAGEQPGSMRGGDRAGLERFLAGELTKPVVGAANASAVAGGFELLLACDVVVASEYAEFGLPEIKRGLFAAGGGVLLATRVPLAVALELNLTGDRIDARRAYALGLVNEVVPREQVLDAGIALAARIARNGPLALRAAKEIARLAIIDYDRARHKQAEWRSKVFDSNDAKEGAAAFVEKRDPVWRGN